MLIHIVIKIHSFFFNKLDNNYLMTLDRTSTVFNFLVYKTPLCKTFRYYICIQDVNIHLH